MKRNVLIVAGFMLLGSVVAIIVLAAVLTPEETNPAYAAAVAFVDAAARGDETAARALMSERLRAFVAARCPEGRVSACIESYAPEEWGAFQSVVFRRAAPDNTTTRAGQIAAYDVDLIATYAEGKGFSGVCIYTRVEQDDDGAWRVAGYAGFVACGDPMSRNMADNPEAPHRAP